MESQFGGQRKRDSVQPKALLCAVSCGLCKQQNQSFSHPFQRLLLQDLHDSHICNSLLVAESEEDIWKSETPYTSYRQRVMPTDGMNMPLAMPQQQCHHLPMDV